MKINPKYKKIATKILYSDQPITKKDLKSLNLFNEYHLEKMQLMNGTELKIKLIDIITRAFSIENR